MQEINCWKTDKVRNLLFKFAEGKETASDVANAVLSNFENIPESIRNELQKRLAKQGYSVW